MAGTSWQPHRVLSHGGEVWVLPLLELVGEVDSEVRAGSAVRGTAESHIAISIEHHIGPGSHHQQVHSDVKLPSPEQERRCDVAERERKSKFISRGHGVGHRWAMRGVGREAILQCLWSISSRSITSCRSLTRNIPLPCSTHTTVCPIMRGFPRPD